jgi:hypothetical protein
MSCLHFLLSPLRHGVLAIGGASGIAIGFAAQKLVSNLIAGLLIFVTQPFKAGLARSQGCSLQTESLVHNYQLKKQEAKHFLSNKEKHCEIRKHDVGYREVASIFRPTLRHGGRPHPGARYRWNRAGRRVALDDCGGAAGRQGMAVQVDPIKPTSTTPGTNRLKLNPDEPLLKIAFKFNLRRYNTVVIIPNADLSGATIKNLSRKAKMVGHCRLKPVESRVESAWFPRLKVECNEPVLRIVFNFNLRRYKMVGVPGGIDGNLADFNPGAAVPTFKKK